MDFALGVALGLAVAGAFLLVIRRGAYERGFQEGMHAGAERFARSFVSRNRQERREMMREMVKTFKSENQRPR